MQTRHPPSTKPRHVGAALRCAAQLLFSCCGVLRCSIFVRLLLRAALQRVVLLVAALRCSTAYCIGPLTLPPLRRHGLPSTPPSPPRDVCPVYRRGRDLGLPLRAPVRAAAAAHRQHAGARTALRAGGCRGQGVLHVCVRAGVCACVPLAAAELGWPACGKRLLLPPPPSVLGVFQAPTSSATPPAERTAIDRLVTLQSSSKPASTRERRRCALPSPF